MGVMNVQTFINKAIDIAKNYNTLYVMGCFGAPLTGANVSRYCTNNAYNKQATRTRMIKEVANEAPPFYGFDCVCLIKGILWGWCGSPKKTYGGAVYKANGVPDTNANGMIKLCKDVSTDFSDIVPGEAVWMDGHIGIYIGNGLAVEATPSWENKVQITAVANIGKKSGYNARKWTSHGKLPYVDYTEAKTESKPVASETAPKATSVKATDPAKSFSGSLVGTYKTTGSLNCRHGAGTTKKIMVAVPKGTKVKCYGYYTRVLGRNWLYVQFTYKGVTYTGFMSTKYLSKA